MSPVNSTGILGTVKVKVCALILSWIRPVHPKRRTRAESTKPSSQEPKEISYVFADTYLSR
jgi:hypothetical protein